MTDNIQNLISQSLQGDNKWRDVFRMCLAEKMFPSMIYKTFFLLSPSSANKFSDMQKQVLVLGGALKLILTDDHKNLEKSSETRRLTRRMKRAHKKHEISELEFHHMKQAMAIAVLYYLERMDKITEFTEFHSGFKSRMNSIKPLIVASAISLSSSKSD